MFTDSAKSDKISFSELVPNLIIPRMSVGLPLLQGRKDLKALAPQVAIVIWQLAEDKPFSGLCQVKGADNSGLS